MPATHTHGATAEMGSSATAAEVRAAAATAEVSAAATSAEVSTTAATSADVTTATAATAASGVSGRRQTQGKAYCGRARRDFPHDMTSSSGPNSSGPNV
jgi:hypothetical protein